MHPLGHRGIKHPVQVDMFVSIGEPLLAPHNMGDLHLPIVDHIGKVEGRPPVSPHYDKIVNRLEFHLPKNLVLELLGPLQEVTFDSDREGFFVADFGFDLFEG